MSETKQAPERIFLVGHTSTGGLCTDGPGGTEYVRADVHRAEVGRVRKSLRDMEAELLRRLNYWRDEARAAERAPLEVERLREWVIHHTWCRFARYTGACNCGLAKALAASPAEPHAPTSEGV